MGLVVEALGVNPPMPWEVEPEGSALHVPITPPMEGEWESLLDAINAASDPPPYAIYLPPRIEGGSAEDADMLRELWDILGKRGIMILPST
jgi:hypothetical protein